MLTTWPRQTPGLATQCVDAHVLPRWVSALFQNEAEDRLTIPLCRFEATLTTWQRGPLVLLRVIGPRADEVAALEFQRDAACAYHAIRERLAGLNVYPIRFWNLIPRIRTTYADGLDRYMVFNAGRFAAYTEWYGGADAFDGAIATATGVGYEGAELSISVLASTIPGIPVENPRQRSAYRYSERYGPMPPSFSRGVLCPAQVEGLPSCIVGGTSSVCGEQSVHAGDVVAQTSETLRNMAALIEAGRHHADQSAARRSPNRQPLHCLHTLRIYLVNEADADAVLPVVAAEVPSLLEPIEMVRADICRPDLLVEIEGTACFGGLEQQTS